MAEVEEKEETEYERILTEAQKAKKTVIGYTVGFFVGLAITIGTLSSSSSFALIAWGAIIFCPIYAIKNFHKYKKLNTFLRPKL